MPQVDAKALRKAIKRRVPYLEANRKCALRACRSRALARVRAEHSSSAAKTPFLNEALRVLRASRRSAVTIKQVRRFLEEDMALPPHALDAEPHKSSVKTQVDTARRELFARVCRCYACEPLTRGARRS
jgi:hypothetical protein